MVDGRRLRAQVAAHRLLLSQHPGLLAQIRQLRSENGGADLLGGATDSLRGRPVPEADARLHRGTSLIRNCPPPEDHRRALGIPLQ